MEAPQNAQIEPPATAGAVLENHMGKSFAQAVEHGVEIFHVPPERVLPESVLDPVASFVDRGIVVQPEHVQIVLLDDAGDL